MTNQEKKIEQLIKENKALVKENTKYKKQKNYGLVWENEKNKEKIVEDCKTKLPILERIKDKEIITDKNKPMNLMIEGDNYHALTCLNYTHKGKVDVIYIDPPYNTGAKDWRYNNNYVDKEDRFCHSKWLNMMFNRLSTAKNLLSIDGVLVCAIDKHEQENLGLLINELFQDYKKTCISVIHNPSGTQGNHFSYNNEFVYFVYRDIKGIIEPEDREDEKADIRSFMNGAKGIAGSHLRETGNNCFYPIFIKDQKIVGCGDVCDLKFHPTSSNILKTDGVIGIYPIDNDFVERKWLFSRHNVENVMEDLYVKKNKKTKNYEIIRIKNKINYKTVWTDKRYNAKKYGSNLIKEILISTEFPFPKSINLVKDCINIVAKNRINATILDFFCRIRYNWACSFRYQ